MDIKTFIKQVLDNTPDGQISLELWVDDNAMVNKEGINHIKLSVTKNSATDMQQQAAAQYPPLGNPLDTPELRKRYGTKS